MAPTAPLGLIQQAIWEARLPLEIRLGPSECRVFDKADPYRVAWPRISYLPLLLPRLHAFFAPYLIADPESVAAEDGYFTYEGVPLKWHLPLGLLYDMYVMSVRDSSSEHPTSGRLLPFTLILNFSRSEPSTQASFISADAVTMHDSFINSVKEADFLRSGNANPIMALPAADSKALWSSTQENDLATFSKIHQGLLPSSGKMKNIPLRLYLPSSSEDDPTTAQMRVLQSHVPPVIVGSSPSTAAQSRAAGGAQPQTMGTALHTMLPGLFPSRRTPITARPVLHGAQLPLSATLEDLARYACYADGWLSVTMVDHGGGAKRSKPEHRHTLSSPSSHLLKQAQLVPEPAGKALFRHANCHDTTLPRSSSGGREDDSSLLSSISLSSSLRQLEPPLLYSNSSTPAVMKAFHLIVAPVLAALVGAQSAPDFPIMVQENLQVTYNASNTEVSPPGVLLPRSDVLEAPTAYRPNAASSDAIYVLFLIDQDVVQNGSKVMLLHWLQPNLVASPNALNFDAVVNGASSAVGAEYIPPTPPGGSGPHRYTFLLFEQPSMWTIPAAFVSINPPADTSARIGFNIEDFVSQSGLGAPIAANYLQVLNGTAAETSSAETMTFAAATSTVSSSAGADATGSMAMTPSAAGSASATAATPAQATDGAAAMRGNTKELLAGLAMAAAGAGLWML